MDIVDFIQKFFIFLLPGLLGVYVYSLLNINKQEHYYFEFLKIIVFSFVSYFLTDVLFSIIKCVIPCFVYSPVDIICLISNINRTIPTPNVLTSIVFALALACLLTKAIYENWLFKIANRLKLTRRIDNETVWEHFFDENEIVVLRDLITQNTYYGKVQTYSDNSQNREICLSDVYVYDRYSEFLYHAQKLYLSRAHNEFSIEVQDEDDPLNQKEGGENRET